jgi:uncharacterized membrane protein YjdF
MLPPRLVILALIVFEVLNLIGILNFTLDFSWFGLIVTSGVTFIIVEAIYYYFREKGTALPIFPYIMVALGLWLDAMGDVGHFYGRYEWYDQLAHLFGGASVMSVALGIVTRYTTKFKLSVAAIIFASLAFTALFGDLYELEEYLEDELYHKRTVRLGDGPDTANDIMLNLTGGLIAGAVYLAIRKKKN